MKKIKKDLCEAHIKIKKEKLAIFTFGNISAISDNREIMYIKPSGVEYSQLSPDNIVEISVKTGEIISNGFKPSSDTDTHLELYRAFNCNSIIHTHSEYASVYAQSNRSIKCSGTTHSDYFRGDIPCTRRLTHAEVLTDYEKNTGKVIIETFNNINPMEVPAVVVANHGPFVWGNNINNAVENSIILEYIAKIQFQSELLLKNENQRIEDYLIDKHYLRKHGKDAYYGQNNK